MGLPRRLAVRLGAQALLVSITSCITNLSLCCSVQRNLHITVGNDLGPLTKSTLRNVFGLNAHRFLGRGCRNCLQQSVVVWGLGNSAPLQALSALKSVLAACRSPGLPVVSVGAALCSGNRSV